MNYYKRAIITVYLLISIISTSFIYFPNPASAETVYTFTGGGKGHGVGMCMTSVLAQAKAGRDFRTIMGYFYRSIRMQRRTSPKVIRAAVYSTGGNLSFQANNSIKVYDTRGRYLKTVLRGEILRIRYGNGRYRVIVFRNGRVIYNRLHSFSVVIKHWRATLIKLRNNGRRFQGDFLARSVGGSSIWAINSVPLENYLKGLGEEPETWPLKGLRTLAVAARTYAVQKILQRKKHYDIAQNQQYYIGLRYAPRLAYAVNSTRGIIATYGGKPILAAYSAHDGGWEADFTSVWGGPGYSYLKGRADGWCKAYKNHRWGPTSFSRTRLQSIFRSRGINIGTLTRIDFLGRGADDQRPQKVKLTGTSGTRTIWAFSQFAAWLGLKSSLMWLKTSTTSTSLATNLAPPRPNISINSSPLIVIDPGHGGRQTGAIGPNGLKEKTVNLKVALKLRKYLKSAGARVIMTRTTDKTLGLASRAYIARKAKANRFISIHHNSAVNRRVNGTETYVRRGADSRSRDMANKIQRSLLNYLGRNNRGVHRAGFYVLRNTTMPAVLTEASFISNRTEASKLRMNYYIDKEAKAIFYGLKAHMNFKPYYRPLAIQGTAAPADVIYFPHVIDTNNFWRGLVSIKNTSTASKAITLNYYADNGNILRSENLTLNAGQTHNFYPRRIIGSNFSGSIIASTSSASLVGKVAQISKTNKAFASVQAVTPATELYVPSMVDATKWRSFISVKNTSDSQAVVAVNYYNSSGSLISSVTTNIEPQAKYNFYPKNSTGSAFNGSAKITSTEPITAYVSRINSAKTRLGIAPAVQKATNMYFAKAYDSSKWRSYLSIQNTSDSTKSINIFAYNSNGTLAKQVNLSVAPKASYENRLLNLIGFRFGGALKITADNESIAAYLTQSDRNSKAMGVIEGQQGLQELNFPFISDDMHWNSEVAASNIGSSAVASIKLYSNAGTETSSKSLTINANGYYSFYPFEIDNQGFNGSLSITAPANQLVGYSAQYR